MGWALPVWWADFSWTSHHFIERNNFVKPFYKVLNESFQETMIYRRQDNRNRNYLSDYRRKLLRSQNFPGKKSNNSRTSKEKKQILISIAFDKACKNAKLTVGRRVELSNITES